MRDVSGDCFSVFCLRLRRAVGLALATTVTLAFSNPFASVINVGLEVKTIYRHDSWPRHNIASRKRWIGRKSVAAPVHLLSSVGVQEKVGLSASFKGDCSSSAE